MDIKKILLAGSAVTAMVLATSCSSDKSSEPDPSDPTLSSSSEGTNPDPNSSGDVTNLSSGVTGSSSSKGDNGNNVTSSSSISDEAEPQMGCSEIMYNAADGSLLEWVEIYIAGGQDISNMAEYQLHLSGAVDYNFPAEPLAKGEYVVVANDLDLFRAAYPTFTGRLFGPWTGGTNVKLPNEGDVVNVKLRGEGDVTCAFSNEPPWPSLADGKGRTLVYLGGNSAQANSWGASAVVGGNPGVGGDQALKPASVRINEIKPFVSEADHSWLELYNMGDTDVDLSGWTVTVKLRKDTLTIKEGSVIPAKGYLVLDGVEGFDKELILSPVGGEFYLRGPQEGEESSLWVPANTGTSGVIDLADGSTAQGPLAEATPGTANAPLQMGSVYINEIYYNPSTTGSCRFEFMELVNSTAQDITLYSSTVQRGWKVEGVNLEFSSIVFPANSMMLLVSDTLAADTGWVRSNYKIDPSVQIVLYKGKLSNRGETIAVKEPYSKSGSGTSISYYYKWHDATLYSDNWPGLNKADGFGYSLQRKDKTTMGYEASAWTVGEPTPGK